MSPKHLTICIVADVIHESFRLRRGYSERVREQAAWQDGAGLKKQICWVG